MTREGGGVGFHPLPYSGTPSIYLSHDTDTNYNYATVQDAGFTDTGANTDYRGLCAGVHHAEYYGTPSIQLPHDADTIYNCDTVQDAGC